MERRLGVIAILVYEQDNVQVLNNILSNYSDIILGRMGLPLREKKVNIISLIVDGSTDEIGALTGKIGKLKGISVKSMLTEFKENK